MMKVAVLFFFAAVAASSAVPVDVYRGVWGVDNLPCYGSSCSGKYLWNILSGHRGICEYGADCDYYPYTKAYHHYYPYSSSYGYPYSKAYHHYFPYSSSYGYYPHTYHHSYPYAADYEYHPYTSGIHAAVYPFHGIHGGVY